jgi:hypothetical protein
MAKKKYVPQAEVDAVKFLETLHVGEELYINGVGHKIWSVSVNYKSYEVLNPDLEEIVRYRWNGREFAPLC